MRDAGERAARSGALPLQPPVEPMLARLVRELPADGFLYEPKWDGFRCLAFVEAGAVTLQSRHGRPLARYFPEVVEGLLASVGSAAVLDGELVVPTAGGLDFATLMARLHPAASRVERLRRESPAVLVAFDVLAAGAETLLDRPFAERRARLERLIRDDGAASVIRTPLTADRAVATRWLDRYRGRGVDGVVAKHRDLRYEPGRRAMLKVKPERTLDAVIGGYRPRLDRPGVASLMLGLYDDAGALRHVGVVVSMPDDERRRMAADLERLAVPIDAHPWAEGFLLEGGAMGRLKGAAGRWAPGMSMDWVPVAPERVAEVAYDQLDGRRLRHPARFVRWRPDREPGSCSFEQLEGSTVPVGELLGGR